MLNANDFKEYRENLGYTNKTNFKNFLSAKDIVPCVDYKYIDSLNNRLKEIFVTINSKYYAPCDIDKFVSEKLNKSFDIIKNNSIIDKLNNQGRRKEEVYFSFMRGFLVVEYFKEFIATVFGVNMDQIKNIGDDDFTNYENFKRTPKADLGFSDIRVEIQSGFQGINDIKQHKVREAKRLYDEKKLKTFVLHFDIFNGQVAVVEIYNITDNDLNWITRQQMEGQSVFNIEQNYFIYSLLKKPHKFKFFTF